MQFIEASLSEECERLEAISSLPSQTPKKKPGQVKPQQCSNDSSKRANANKKKAQESVGVT